jgi:hypothetical protein
VTNPRSNRTLALALPLFLAIAAPAAAASKCGSVSGDGAAVAATRAAAEAQCDCAGARSHGKYVACVADAVKEAVRGGTLRKQCSGEVVSCAARSSCGRSGFVTCCRTDAKGVSRCSLKRSSDRCKVPKGGSACVGTFASCCDACSPDGSCASSTTTTIASATTTTAHTTTTVQVTTTTASTTTTTTSTTTTTIATTSTTSSTTEASTTTTSSTTTTTIQVLEQCCVASSPGGAFDTCIPATATDCAAQNGIDVGPGPCDPGTCPPQSTTTTESTTTTTEASTTTTSESSTTTTTMGPACCEPAHIETTSSAGTLQVSTLPAFPFPPNVLTTIEVGAGDADCRHTGIVPAGGFSVPAFCIPALGYTSDVIPKGCASGGAAGAAVVWDAVSTAPDPNITRVGDTSDPDDGSCGTLGSGCTTVAGGAGADTKGNINTTRGGSPIAGGAVHTLVDIPVTSITWNDVDLACPDPDGVFDPGNDTLVTQFDFILSPTTGSSSATFTDLNGDSCSRAGNGPNSQSGSGSPAEGPCCVVGQATTVLATGVAFSGAAPLYDLSFKSITPTTISNCSAPQSADTCTLTADPCQD